MESIKKLIESEQWADAKALLEKELSGIDWDGAEFANQPTINRDLAVYRIISHCNEARVMRNLPNELFHHKNLALLWVDALSGDISAKQQAQSVESIEGEAAAAELKAIMARRQQNKP